MRGILSFSKSWIFAATKVIITNYPNNMISSSPHMKIHKREKCVHGFPPKSDKIQYTTYNSSNLKKKRIWYKNRKFNFQKIVGCDPELWRISEPWHQGSVFRPNCGIICWMILEMRKKSKSYNIPLKIHQHLRRKTKNNHSPHFGIAAYNFPSVCRNWFSILHDIRFLIKILWILNGILYFDFLRISMIIS